MHEGRGASGRARIVANKNMMLEQGQESFSLGAVSGRKAVLASRIPDYSLTPLARSTKFPQSLTPAPARICENECLTMSTDNLLSLKDDMVAFIEGHGLHRLPGYVTEDIPSIVWEGQGNPDAWKDFVEMAKHVGAPFVTFSEMTLEREELDALIEEAGEMNFPDEEATELVEANGCASTPACSATSSSALSTRASSSFTKPPPSGTSASRRCLKTSRASRTSSSTTHDHTTTRTSKPRAPCQRRRQPIP